jgi:hypothetical protein
MPEANAVDASTRSGWHVPFAANEIGPPPSSPALPSVHPIAGYSVTLAAHETPLGLPHEQLVQPRVSSKLVALGITM